MAKVKRNRFLLDLNLSINVFKIFFLYIVMMTKEGFTKIITVMTLEAGVL